MATKQLTALNFQPTVASEGIVVIDCWAPWCGVCRSFAPIYEDAATEFPSHRFATLDTQSEPLLAGELGIENLPTLIVFRDGIPLFNQAGNFKAEDLSDIISQAENLDMDVVRFDIASESAKARCA